MGSGNREASTAEVQRLPGDAMWGLGGCDKDLRGYSKSKREHLEQFSPSEGHDLFLVLRGSLCVWGMAHGARVEAGRPGRDAAVVQRSSDGGRARVEAGR